LRYESLFRLSYLLFYCGKTQIQQGFAGFGTGSRYPDARVVFLAGSLVRGEGTSTSDLDLVVVFDHIPCAYRESFIYENWPVEAFVHDSQTLEYFFREVDRPTGFPSLPTMVTEGVEIPGASEFSNGLKRMAARVLCEGPPTWSETDLKNSRYIITDLIEDIRDPRTPQELHATASLLYSALANHYFRSRNLWSAKGKTIPRRLNTVDPELAAKFLGSFDSLFLKCEAQEVISLAEGILEPEGGFLFQDHKLLAPESWRIE
jgi:Nucleotidyltransferase domain